RLQKWLSGVKCHLKHILLLVIGCSGCEDHMNNSDYIDSRGVQNNFRTPQIIDKTETLIADVNLIV
ncbi:MAG: hypothetical protein PHO60_05185, partial [Methanothrix sp.]|nr:hypothetical protein [Methanothrix sp.]